MLPHVLNYWLTSGTKFPMSYGQMARIQTNLGWCYCSCIKPITWVWWYLPKSQHSVSGQEELGIQGLSYLRSTSEQNQELCCNDTRKSALVGGLFLWKWDRLSAGVGGFGTERKGAVGEMVEGSWYSPVHFLHTVMYRVTESQRSNWWGFGVAPGIALAQHTKGLSSIPSKPSKE